MRGAAQVVEPVAEDRNPNRHRQRQQHGAEEPAGNAAGEYDGNKEERRRAGGQREKQQLLAYQRPAAPPPADESGNGTGSGSRGQQDPGGAERVRDAPVAAGQAQWALPVGEPVLLRVRAQNVAEEQAGHRRGGAPAQPSPARAGQAAVREHRGYGHHGDQHSRRLQARSYGGHVPGAGDRARGGNHAADAGVGERSAGARNGCGGQQQPADPVAGYREGDDRADDGDRGDGESERQCVGEHRGAGLVVGGCDRRTSKGNHDRRAGRARGEAAAGRCRRRALHRLMVHHVSVSGENHLSGRRSSSGRGPVAEAAGEHRDGGDQPGERHQGEGGLVNPVQSVAPDPAGERDHLEQAQDADDIVPAVTRPLRSSQAPKTKNAPNTTAAQGRLPGYFSSQMMTALPNSPRASTPAIAVKTVSLRPFMLASQ